jgi:hypothetical protein
MDKAADYYEHFEADISKVWIRRLDSEFRSANSLIEKHLKQRLETPQLKLVDVNSYWGKWFPSTRTVALSLDLLRSHPWGATRYILRHEIAHMVVSEIFNMGDLRTHGEAFTKACKILNIPDHCCASSEYLKKLGDKDSQNIVSKVKKLMALGESDNENESKLAMAKAHKLMMKHNLENLDEESRNYHFRPVGPSTGRIPTYSYTISRIVREFYFVKTIIMSRPSIEKTDKWGWTNYVKQSGYELFGTVENLDLAEYVFHFLWNQGELAWEEFKKDKTYIKGYYSKASFLSGFYNGYYQKLKDEKPNIEADSEDGALIAKGDKILKEMFDKHYGKTRSIRSSGPTSGGYDSGKAAGSKLKFRQGVASGGSGTKMIGG